MTKFIKSHGLGNSYIVLDQEKMDFELTKDKIIKICNIDFGIGSDGILLKVPGDENEFGLRIFNPDGSEAEISGNGIRIFGKYLFDYKFTKEKMFTVATPHTKANIHVLATKNDKATLLKAEMGIANFYAPDIPVNVSQNEVIDYALKIDNDIFNINCVSLGNPHCVVFMEKLDKDKILKFGSLIENHPIFPSRINVQFARILAHDEIEILIWERGAGYTQASGSSSCAVAALAKKRYGLNSNITIKMPGGTLDVEIKEDWNLLLTGPVEQVCEGILSDALKA
jgi:diaminopimelate epimerase